MHRQLSLMLDRLRRTGRGVAYVATSAVGCLMLRASFLLCVVVSSLMSTTGAAEIQIDQAAYELLLSAHETNAAAFPRGRMKVHFVRELPQNEQQQAVEAEFVWDGNRIWTEYSYTETVGGAVQEQGPLSRQITTPAERLWYGPDVELATRNRPVPREHSLVYLRLLPSDCWFTTEIGISRTWAEMLDPNLGGTTSPGMSSSRSVRR